MELTKLGLLTWFGKFKVRAKSKLVEAQAKAGGTQLTSEISIEIQGQDRPAMVAETVSIVFE